MTQDKLQRKILINKLLEGIDNNELKKNIKDRKEYLLNLEKKMEKESNEFSEFLKREYGES